MLKFFFCLNLIKEGIVKQLRHQSARDKTVAWALVIALLLILQACVSNDEGRIVPEKNRIHLKAGGPHSGNWSVPPVVFNYRYTLASNQLDLSGEIEGRTALHIRVVTDFSFWVYFLDADGKSMGNRPIRTAEGRRRNRSALVNQTIELPPGTTAIAFGYRGSIREGGRDGASRDFWVTPFQ